MVLKIRENISFRIFSLKNGHSRDSGFEPCLFYRTVPEYSLVLSSTSSLGGSKNLDEILWNLGLESNYARTEPPAEAGDGKIFLNYKHLRQELKLCTSNGSNWETTDPLRVIISVMELLIFMQSASFMNLARCIVQFLSFILALSCAWYCGVLIDEEMFLLYIKLIFLLSVDLGLSVYRYRSNRLRYFVLQYVPMILNFLF